MSELRKALLEIAGDSELEKLLEQVDELASVDDRAFAAYKAAKKEPLIERVDLAFDWLQASLRVLLQRAIDRAMASLAAKLKDPKSPQDMVLADVARKALDDMNTGKAPVSFFRIREIGTLLELLGFDAETILLLGCVPTGWWLRLACDPIKRRQVLSVLSDVEPSLYWAGKEKVTAELKRGGF